jgi:class 3 adenylate cyclase
MADGQDASPLVLASDAERDRVALVLRDAAGEGRLTLEELSERLGWVYESRTSTELEVITRDLPEHAAASGAPQRKRRRWVVAVMSGARRKGRWRPDERCVALAVMGGCKLDLRDAEIQGERLDITAVSIMGGVKIVVPEGIEVDVGGVSIMGGKHVKVRDLPPRPGTPVIHVRVLSLMGGVEVASRPSRLAKRLREGEPRPAGGHPTTLDELATTVAIERPSLRAAAAPDGTITILFSDIEGSTRLNERLGDLGWFELLRRHQEVVREQIQMHGGFEVKTQGDGFMVTFSSARRAVQCACAIQREVECQLGGHPDGEMRVRIGLHTGEAIKRGDDFYGKNIVLAARIADRARGGEILASAVVKQLTESAGDFRFEQERKLELEGLAGAHSVYEVTSS